MQVYCPRCATTYSDLEPEAFADGVCNTCAGQLITGEFQASMALPGAIAMTFETGSRVAIPFCPQYDEATLEDAQSAPRVEEDTPTTVHTSVGDGADAGPAPAVMGDDPTVRDDSVAAFAAQASGLAPDAPLSETDLFGGDGLDAGTGEQHGGATEELQLGGDEAPAIDEGSTLDGMNLAGDDNEGAAGELELGGDEAPAIDDGPAASGMDATGAETAAESGSVDAPVAGFAEETSVDAPSFGFTEETAVDAPAIPDPEQTPEQEAAAAEGANAPEPSAGDEATAGGLESQLEPDDPDDEAARDDSAADESAADDGAADDSAADDGAADESAADDSVADDSAADDSAADDGATDDGAADESAADDGATDDGAADESAADESAADDGAAEQPAAAAGDAAMPAHLSLPTMDFSVPDVSGGDAAEAAPPAEGAVGEPTAEQPAAAQTEAAETPPAEPSDGAGDDGGADAAGGALPAHLQLPSFPAFDINFDPDAADEKAAEAQAKLEQEKREAEEVSLPSDTPEGEAAAPAHLEPGAAPPGPPPPPPPLKKKKKAEPAGPLPGLPNLGALPDLAPVEMNREPTLLGSDALARVAEIDQKSSVLPIVLGIVVVVLALGGIGYWQKDAIVTALSGDTGEVGPQETSADKAKRMLADGLKSVDKAKTLEGEDKKKRAAKAYQAAVGKFREAIELDPKLPRAHRELAVVFATLKKEKRAVDHYRKYVSLAPDADDADDVKKIIKDWEKAQEKENGSDKKKKKK